MPDLAPILGTKFDALRSVEMPGAKLYLFKEGTTSERKYVPLGLVRRGWRVNPRRFDRFGEALLEVMIARSASSSSELLETVAGFGILPKGVTAGKITKCTPTGIATLATEPVWRLRAEGRTNQGFDTAEEQGVFEDSFIKDESGARLIAG